MLDIDLDDNGIKKLANVICGEDYSVLVKLDTSFNVGGVRWKR